MAEIIEIGRDVALKCPECGSMFWIITVDKVDFEKIVSFQCIDQENCGYKVTEESIKIIREDETMDEEIKNDNIKSEDEVSPTQKECDAKDMEGVAYKDIAKKFEEKSYVHEIKREFIEPKDPHKQYNADEFGMLFNFKIRITSSANCYTLEANLKYYSFAGTLSLTSAMMDIMSDPQVFVTGEMHLPVYIGESEQFNPIEHPINISPTHNNGIIINIGCFQACFTGYHRFMEMFNHYINNIELFRSHYQKFSEMNSCLDQPYAPEQNADSGPMPLGRNVAIRGTGPNIKSR